MSRTSAWQGRRSTIVVSWTVAALLSGAGISRGEEPSLLWEIGKPDGGNAEFALAPGGFAKFKEDAFFVVGESDPRRDWPYLQPGPVDAWAGGREHTFTVLFGLAAAPAGGACRLRVDLLDTHSQGPPKLRIRVNGKEFERQMPRGAGDDSVRGEPAKGKKFRFDVDFPGGLLRAGDNQVHITTLTGSWILYDSLGLETPPGLALAKVEARTLVDRIQPVRALKERGGVSLQPVVVSIRHFGSEPEGSVRVEGGPALSLHLRRGPQKATLLVPAVSSDTRLAVSVEVAGKVVATEGIVLRPVRKLVVYILPHSHTDIGYTDIQTAIETKQVNNLLQGIEYARKTAGYPEGARFVWNVEVLWAADLYLRRLSEAQKADFLEAVKAGKVALNGMYLNELTGLCRPEELLRLFRFATVLSEKTGVPIDSCMISDVPGYVWSTVPAMAQAGIRYFSTAPNYFDRIGTILREWENKPFWWVGPDGKSKVLVWIPYRGYALSHIIGKLTPEYADELQGVLEKADYPYDIAYVRWSGHGDNAVPDPSICEFVKEWSDSYAWPRFLISSTSAAFRAFDAKYGDKIPHVRGDWTPYWEDGAGSSALETSLNRWSSDRLAQAEALFAMLEPAAYPAAEFEDAWDKVLLYSEHTWGAWCSVTEPERKETKEQWEIKRGYALEADALSRKLLQGALAREAVPSAAAKPRSLRVINTLSWPRTDLVVVPKDFSAAGDGVVDGEARAVPSQRLSTGELAFLASGVPALGSRGFALASGGAGGAGAPAAAEDVKLVGSAISNGTVRVRVDETTGGIVELSVKGIDGNFADTRGGESLNDYRYLVGDDLKDLRRNGPVTIRVGETGPLVGSLLVESEAPGANRLVREVRLVAGLDSVEIIDTVDKKRLESKSYMAREGKESVNFAFPFDVPEGQVRLDIPFAVFRPELDQMPSACKNWLTVGRWADVSNDRRGITWVTLDAPLVEVGGITATLLNSQTNPDVWRKTIEPTQKIYSWAMNNHWGTNYRAYQEGPVTFRFVLRPHAALDTAEASRFAIGRSQPLIVIPSGGAGGSPSLFRVEPADVIVAGLKPSDDGKALIIRLFAAGGKDAGAKILWTDRRARQAWLSGTSERPVARVEGPIEVPAWGLVTVRVDR